MEQAIYLRLCWNLYFLEYNYSTTAKGPAESCFSQNTIIQPTAKGAVEISVFSKYIYATIVGGPTKILIS